MDYLEKIQQLFQCTLNDIEERVKLVTVEFSVCPSDLPPYEGLLSLLTSFPERDNVKFFFRDDGGSNYTIVSHGEQNKEEYERLKTGIFEEDPVHISIEINKQVVDNRLSIYSFDRFCEDLLSLTVTEALKAFVDLYAEAEHLYFKVYGNELFYKTGTMAFASADHTIAWGLPDRNERLERCRETSCFYNQSTYPLLPEDFYAEVDFNGNPLSRLFKQISSALSLAYLSTNSSILCEELRIQITGQRNMDYSVQLSDITPNDELYRIYHWIFTDGNVVDKALLARNSISSHCKLTGISNLDGRTFASIQANYNLYLKDNVAKYIELTNAMAGFIQESTNNVSECISQLLGNLKSNILAVMSFVFTVVLANIVSGQPIENIFTFQIKIIMYIVFIGSLVYYFISVAEVIYKKRKMVKQYDDLIAHYEKVLPNEEIEQITGGGRARLDAESSLNHGMIVWSAIWIAMILATFIIVDYIGDTPHLVADFFRWVSIWQSRLDSVYTTISYADMYDGFVNIISLVLLIDSARGLWGQHKFFKRTKTKVTNCDQIDDDLLDATLNLMDTTGKHSKIFLGILVALFFLQLCMKDWGGMKRITTVMTFVSIVFALTVSRRSNRIVKQIRESE